ncbi:MAG: hypothetical protein J7L71_03560 [Spirochaetaceae bacterium]|nr:hypothetical protein [Spirochaetaceae bacterium]
MAKSCIDFLNSLSPSEKRDVIEKIIFITNQLSEGNSKGIRKIKDKNLFRMKLPYNIRCLFNYGQREFEEVVWLYRMFYRKEGYKKILDGLRLDFGISIGKTKFEEILEVDTDENISEGIDEEISFNEHLLKEKSYYVPIKKRIEDIISLIQDESNLIPFNMEENTNRIIKKIKESVSKSPKSGIYLFHGVPGTGKSILLLRIIEWLNEIGKSTGRKDKTLLLVPTHRLKNDFYIKKLQTLDIGFTDYELVDKKIENFVNHWDNTGLGILTFDEFFTLINSQINGSFHLMEDINAEVAKILDDKIHDHSFRKIYDIQDLVKLFNYYQDMKFTKFHHSKKDGYIMKIENMLEGCKHYFEKKCKGLRDKTIVGILEKASDNIKILIDRLRLNNGLNILVDEIQNMYLGYIYFLSKLFKETQLLAKGRNYFIVTGDMFQRMELSPFYMPEVQNLLNREFKGLNISIEPPIELTYSFRTPKEIANYAAEYLETFLQYMKKHLDIRQKYFPVIKADNCIYSYSQRQDKLMGIVTNEVFEKVKNEVFQSISNVKGKNLVLIYEDKFENRKPIEGLFPIKIENVKGLEFESVLVYNMFPEDKNDYDEIFQIYTALTRTTGKLLHLIVGDDIEFLKQKIISFNPKFKSYIDEELEDNPEMLKERILSLLTKVEFEKLKKLIEGELERIEHSDSNIEDIQNLRDYLFNVTINGGYPVDWLKIIIDKIWELYKNGKIKDLNLLMIKQTPEVKGLLNLKMGKYVEGLCQLAEASNDELSTDYYNELRSKLDDYHKLKIHSRVKGRVKDEIGKDLESCLSKEIVKKIYQILEEYKDKPINDDSFDNEVYIKFLTCLWKENKESIYYLKEVLNG